MARSKRGKGDRLFGASGWTYNDRSYAVQRKEGFILQLTA
jgi:hypothetical protein